MAIVFVTVKTESFTFWVNVYIRVGKPRLVDLGELSVNKVSVNKPSRVENRAGIVHNTSQNTEGHFENSNGQH